jgi:hypothetical protein
LDLSSPGAIFTGVADFLPNTGGATENVLIPGLRSAADGLLTGDLGTAVDTAGLREGTLILFLGLGLLLMVLGAVLAGLAGNLRTGGVAVKALLVGALGTT